MLVATDSGSPAQRGVGCVPRSLRVAPTIGDDGCRTSKTRKLCAGEIHVHERSTSVALFKNSWNDELRNPATSSTNDTESQLH